MSDEFRRQGVATKLLEYIMKEILGKRRKIHIEDLKFCRWQN